MFKNKDIERYFTKISYFALFIKNNKFEVQDTNKNK